jgi:hypothetical protein
MMAGLEKPSGVQILATLAYALLLRYALTSRPDLFVPAIVLGVVAVLIWLAKRLYEGDLFKKAMRLAEKDDHVGALGLLIRAEAAWDLNHAHRTPKTIANSFRRLAGIVTAIQGQVQKLGGTLDAEEMAKAIAVYVNVYSNKKNLVFGTHMLKKGPKSEIKRADQVFPILRGRFRATCQQLYKNLGQSASSRAA